nr:reverse transcriptase domain-containing protein [Tanacetum cinerariifolium]
NAPVQYSAATRIFGGVTQNKSIVSQVKSSDANSSSSEIAILTHAVNQQTSVVTTAMTAILKQFQLTPPSAFVKAVEEICVTCGGAHPYYQCLAAGGNTFPELRDNIQAITTRSGIVLDGPSVPIPPPFINPEEDERVEKTLTDQDLADPPFKQRETFKTGKHLNENCSAVILKKLSEKLRDPGKFLILCGFNELKCKALSDLGASINLMPLSVWKNLGLPELISTRMTLKLANRAICTSTGIARDVVVPVSKFTFLADFVIVDYESDPRFPLILGRPFLLTARALIDVHREVMILCDDDERLILNMRHETSSYSNQPQTESVNMISIFNDSSEDFLKNLFATNHQCGNPTFSSHPQLTSPKVKDDVFDSKGGNVLTEKLLGLDSTKDLYPPHIVNPLSCSTTTSYPTHLLEEFADELALITFPPGNDDLPFDIESDLKKIEYLLNHDPIKDMDSILEDLVDEDNLADLNDNLADTMLEMFTEEHALDYSSLSLYDEYDDDLFEVDDFLPSFEYDSFLLEDFSKVDSFPSTDNEDKDFDPPLYELPFFKEVPGAKTLLSFSFKNEEKNFKPGILTSKGVHSSLILELSH